MADRDSSNPPLSDEQLEWISDQTAHAVRKAVRAQTRRAMAGFLIMLVGVGAALVAIESRRSSDLRLAERGDHQAIALSCKRVNALRAQSNNGNYTQFLKDTSDINREKLLAKMGSDERVHDRSAHTAARHADRLTVTALTNCDQATEVPNPAKYLYPAPERIGDAYIGRPTASAQRVERESLDLIRHLQQVRERGTGGG